MRRPVLCVAMAVPSATLAAQAPAKWHLVEEWRVGGEAEGPHSFDANLGLARLPSGGFVHYDWKSFKLSFLDSLGRPLRTVGRKGGGPGEFQIVNGLTVSPSGAVILNDLIKGFSIFSETGAFKTSIKPRGAKQGTGGLWRATAFRDGRLVELVQPLGKRAPPPFHLLWSADLLHAETLPRCATNISASTITFTTRTADGPAAMTFPARYVNPDDGTAFDPQGFMWEATDPSSNVIVKHALGSCLPLATVRLGGNHARLTATQQKSIKQDAAIEAKRWESVPPDLSRLSPFQAWFRNLYVDKQGNLWVERVREDGVLHLEVYSPSGTLLAELGDGVLPLFPMFSGNKVYGLVRDEDDIRYLAAFKIVR